MMASPLGHCFHSHVVQFSQGHLKTSFPITIINYAVYVFSISSTLQLWKWEEDLRLIYRLSGNSMSYGVRNLTDSYVNSLVSVTQLVVSSGKHASLTKLYNLFADKHN